MSTSDENTTTAAARLKMKSDNKFALFILSHGRPDNVYTVRILRHCGYTGKIYIIVDDEDKTLDRYRENFKDDVIVFSKKDYEGKFDLMDNFDGNKVIVYARNACYDIARELELDYFFEYEDDYTNIEHKYGKDSQLKAPQIKNLDALFGFMITCLDNTGANTIAFSQGGDFIGGCNSSAFKSCVVKRKAMNSFLFKVNDEKSKDIVFVGRMNDDVNTYLSQGKIGKLFFQTKYVCVVQNETQSMDGGNTEEYKKYGTYVKSFYSVMIAPSCCKIGMMGVVNKRMHHLISWKNAVPKIIRQTI